jgi:methionyl-tRNA formyltransferase
VNEWPIYEDFEAQMAHEGGQLLAQALPEWVAGKIEEQEQDHSQATFAKKITKGDGLIDTADLNLNAPSEKAYAAFRKIQAFHQWPTAYFFTEQAAKKIRVKIIRASFKDGKLKIEKVVPEGSKEMAYGDFLKGSRS